MLRPLACARKRLACLTALASSIYRWRSRARRGLCARPKLSAARRSSSARAASSASAVCSVCSSRSSAASCLAASRLSLSSSYASAAR